MFCGFYRMMSFLMTVILLPSFFDPFHEVYSTMQGGQTPQTRRMDALLKRPENKVCFDCGARQPRWASANFGIFLCLRCAGFHRSLGVHICTIKSTNMDIWDDAMLDVMDRIGNEKAVMLYNARIPAHYRKPEPMSSNADLERAVRLKYGTRDYWSPDYDELYKEILAGSIEPPRQHAPAPAAAPKPTPVAQTVSPPPAASNIVQGKVVDAKADWGGFEESKVARATVIQPVQQVSPVAPSRQKESAGALDDFFSSNAQPTQVKKAPVAHLDDDDMFGSIPQAPQQTAPKQNAPRDFADDIFGEMPQAPPPKQSGGYEDDFFGDMASTPQQQTQRQAPPQKVAGGPTDPFRSALDAFTGGPGTDQKTSAASQPSMSELAYSSNIRTSKDRAW